MSVDAPPVVVVGAGLAGLRVVEELRRAGCTGGLVLVGAESDPPYDRPPLSKQVLRGEADLPLLRTLPDYAELELDLRLGTTVIGVDPATHAVTLQDGTVLTYATLVLAPGAEPRTLPGVAPRPGLFVLRTHDDAVALRDAVREAGRLVVVGGGFIGCEAAASGIALGASVDLVEVLSGPLVRAVGPVMAARVRRLHEDHGVRLHTGTGVAQVLGADRVEGVVLDDGSRIDSPVVLVGLGVAPATGWLAGSGLDLGADGSLLCDAFGRTSASDVWAVGDAAAWTDPTGRQRRREHWMSAVEQAAAVAASLTGQPEDLVAPTAAPYFWSDQYDSSIQALGEVAPETEVVTGEVGDGLVALHGVQDTLLGVVLFDEPKLVGRTRKLMRNQATLTQAREALLG